MSADARQTGPVLEAIYRVTLRLLPTLEKFSRSQRLRLGARRETTALDGLDLLIQANGVRVKERMAEADSRGIGHCRGIPRACVLLSLLLTASPLPAQAPAQIDWPRDLYNPNPRPDDVLLPLPCGGAMAFRWVQAEGQVPAGVESALAPLFRLVGPFEHEGRHDLLLGKYEVSRLQYETLPALTGGFCPPVEEAGRLVQGGVGWYDALGFAAYWSRWLAQHAQTLPECARAATLCVPRVAGRDALVRLPTEAEWEYAARGGLAVTPAQFGQPLYPMPDGLEHHAWYERNSDQQLKPIGQRAASPLGLHDLYGNVEELTLDLYRSALYPGQSGAAVIRGGSVYTPRGGLDAGQRRETPLYGHGEANRAPDNGFRLLIEVPAAPGSALVTAAALPAPGAVAAKGAATTGQLQVNVDTPAQVRIDGTLAGQAAPGAPVEVRGLALGEHLVELSAAGYQAVSERHGVAVGRWTQVAVTMQPSSWLGTLTAALAGAWRALAAAVVRAPMIALALLGLVAFAAIRAWVGRRRADPGRQPMRASENHVPIALAPPEMIALPGGESTGRIATAAGQLETASTAALGGPFEPTSVVTRQGSVREAPAVSAGVTRTPILLMLRQAFEPPMIALPGGEFWMGSPEDEPERYLNEDPRHRVGVPPFGIGKTAVTFAQYDAFCEATGRAKPRDAGWGRDQRPVIDVSWEDAVAYALWLSERTDEPYRLPSEAQWEYAARAGTETPFWTGRCISTDLANYDGNYDYNGCGAKTGVYRHQTVPVGSLPANPWGLHEVHGNVWEWVKDTYHDSYTGAPTDGSAWELGGRSARVVRGGSWSFRPRLARAAVRFWLEPGARNSNLGFRLARTLSP